MNLLPFEQILAFKSTNIKAALSREMQESQKLSPFENMVEKDGGVPIHPKLFITELLSLTASLAFIFI